MKVELDVFSGLPNPSWDLSPEEAEEFTKRLADLHPVDQAPADPGLGYRGFVVSSPEREIRIYQGVVTVSEGGMARHYADLKGIEGWLAEQTRRRGDEDLVAGIG